LEECGKEEKEKVYGICGEENVAIL